MLNQIILGGRLVRDPESKRLSSGLVITEITVACDQTKKGEGKKPLFIKARFFGGVAENIAKYFNKGKAIEVIGRLECEEYTDKQNVAHKEFLIIGSGFEFPLTSKQADGEQNPAPKAPVSQDLPLDEPTGIKGSNLEGLDVIEDDLPF